MTRPVLAAVVLCSFLTSAEATTVRPKPFDRPAGLHLLLPKRLPPATVDALPPAEAKMTAETEVLLDGRPCEYKEVPPAATVVRMVLAPDGTTIIRVEFRSGK
jgi:hypothetical protein